MREIKFRAWDNERKKIFNVTNVNFVNKECYVDIGEDFSLRLYDNFILEQFTGLKDKNAQDIYEGDILNVDSKYHAKVVGGVRGYCYDCVTNTNRFDSPSLYHIAKYHTCEIVGNIHKNKELMES